MALVYATQQVGVADGTTIPALKADGAQVNAKLSSITASKPVGTALNSGDTFFLGTVPAGARVAKIWVTTDTSFGTATVSIGTLASASKYVAAKTNTVTDVPTLLGPKASTLDDGQLTAEEDLYVTIGTANIGAAVIATFEVEITSVK